MPEVAGALDPVDDCGDREVNRVSVELEPWVVIDVATLVEVWLVDEVPAGLPAATLSLDFVSKSCALNEGVVALEVSHIGVVPAVHS